jgi:hypothetical protein
MCVCVYIYIYIYVIYVHTYVYILYYIYIKTDVGTVGCAAVRDSRKIQQQEAHAGLSGLEQPVYEALSY